MQPIAVGQLFVSHPESLSRPCQIEQNQLRQHEEVNVSHGRYPSTSAVETTRANRPSSTSSVRSRISAVEKRRPARDCMGKVNVASPTNCTLKPASEACRVVVSQHCSVRMPVTRISSTPWLRSQLSSVTPEVVFPYRAECTSLINTSSASKRSSGMGRTNPDCGWKGSCGSDCGSW